MTQKINPFVLKPFAANATNNGQFGSYEEGTKKITNDYNEIQALPAWEEGWNSAVKSGTVLPRLEEMQGLQYTTTSAITCLNQQGIREWLADETYYIGSVVKFTQNNVCYFYYSIIDNNINNLPTPGIINNFWKRIDQHLPLWRNDITYKTYDKVCFVDNGLYYEFMSRIDNNLNNTPEVGNNSNVNWRRIYPDLIHFWEAAKTYAGGEKVSYFLNNTYYEYISNVNNNIGHTPPDSQGDEWWYRVVAPQTQFSLFTNVVNLGQVSSYTAPADGYFMVTGGLLPPADSSSSFIIRINNVIVIRKDVAGIGSETLDKLGVYVKKGAVIACAWSGQVRTITCAFAYTN